MGRLTRERTKRLYEGDISPVRGRDALLVCVDWCHWISLPPERCKLGNQNLIECTSGGRRGRKDQIYLIVRRWKQPRTASNEYILLQKGHIVFSTFTQLGSDSNKVIRCVSLYIVKMTFSNACTGSEYCDTIKIRACLADKMQLVVWEGPHIIWEKSEFTFRRHCAWSRCKSENGVAKWYL